MANVFALEALRAKHGDALLLHYGTTDEPHLAVIDGGPSGVYRQALRPRLLQLRSERSADESPLTIDLLMVSHIDDDHIHGLVELADELCERQDDHDQLPFELRECWHNTFDDLVGKNSAELWSASLVAMASSGTPANPRPAVAVAQATELLLASVAQGRDLRRQVEKLGLTLNRGKGLVSDALPAATRLRGNLALTVVGPSRQRIDDLQKEWDKKLEDLKRAEKKPSPAEAAAYVDNSVYNLSSIVVLVEFAGKRMLLTGDARGDEVLAGLGHAGLLENERMHVDLLKVPHHGSDRNLDTDFFRAVTADHYVISADGKYGNPEPETIDMIAKARKGQAYTLHMTYAADELKEDYPVAKLARAHERARKAGAGVRLLTPKPGQLSLSVALV
jgi:hypothetical protein